jgi:hypothetical protein
LQQREQRGKKEKEKVGVAGRPFRRLSRCVGGFCLGCPDFSFPFVRVLAMDFWRSS